MSAREPLRVAVEHLHRANRVIVLSGAGMSTAAGIPDFRSPGGLYGTSKTLLARFTYLEQASKSACARTRAAWLSALARARPPWPVECVPGMRRIDRTYTLTGLSAKASPVTCGRALRSLRPLLWKCLANVCRRNSSKHVRRKGTALIRSSLGAYCSTEPCGEPMLQESLAMHSKRLHGIGHAHWL
mmetsp:Transcript_96817/g.252475  ORF Transcript_96817/g.252475 Transcript_96817/m.252475 type:complete len:186 (-) Transcript_96817:24-581(-)